MKPLAIAALATVAAATAGLPRLSASTAGAEPDLPALVAGAEWIGEFAILEARPRLLPDGAIETRYTLSTILPMKGAMPPIVEVRIPGGEVAGRGLILPGMPDFEMGERAILFLSEQGATKPWRMPVGLAAGSFRVVITPGSRKVVRDMRRLNAGALEVGEYDELVGEIFAEVEKQR